MWRRAGAIARVLDNNRRIHRMLTPSQRKLVRVALSSPSLGLFVTREQRAAIRELCAGLKPDGQPEKILIAFKSALEEAADEAHVPLGSERSLMLSRIISVFIDELYSCNGIGPRRVESRSGLGITSGVSPLTLERKSSGTRP